MPEHMFHQAIKRLLLVPPINLATNLLGALVTFVWFAVMGPGEQAQVGSDLFWERLMVFSSLIVVVLFAVIPVNLVWIFKPILRPLKRIRSSIEGGDGPSEKANLEILVGRLLDLPIKLSVTTFACWIVAALLLDVAPEVIPAYYPWTFETTHKIVAWMIFVGAPSTVFSAYFVTEWWIRKTAYEAFPHEALSSLPQAWRINVLPKLLIVTLLIGILPVALMSHVVLHSITEIQAGKGSILDFLDQMPHAIRFLTAWAVILAVGLSVFMSKSISEPLRYARAALERIARGDLDAVVPVVSNDDIGTMADQLNRMVRSHKELDAIRDTFGRYLSQEVVEEILKSPGGVELRGELREMTIMVADLRGFTALAESQHPTVVLELLNRFLQRMTDIIIDHGGTIDEFTGDGILVFFGAPRRMPDHATRAVVCSIRMQESMQALNRDNRAAGLPELHMGIGINSGELIVGNIGSEKRKKYGAVGSPINVAFRVEGCSRAGEILLTPSVLSGLDGDVVVDAYREVQLKGFDKPMMLHRAVCSVDYDVP